MKSVAVRITLDERAPSALRRAWGSRHRLDLPDLTLNPALTLSLSPAHPFNVFSLDGRMYAPVRQGYPSAGSVAADFSHHINSIGSVSARDTSFLSSRLAVVNATACRIVEEPHWYLSLDNGHREDRPAQIRTGLRLFQKFPRSLAPSDAPSIAFRADRKTDLDLCVERLRELHPRSTLIPSTHRCLVHDVEALGSDTLAMSVHAISRALTGTTHKALSTLPRAAIECWMDMRKSADPTTPEAEAAFLRATAALAPLLRLPSLHSDPEAMKWRRRAAIQADLLMLRLAMEPTYETETELHIPGPQP